MTTLLSMVGTLGVEIPAMLAAAAGTQPAGPTTGPATKGAVQKPLWAALFESPMTILILAIVLFYILMIRSKRNQDRQRQDMLGQLKRGDRIQTIGGILGTVLEAREDEVLVKVDETSNAKIRFARSAIHRVLDVDKPADKTAEKTEKSSK